MEALRIDLAVRSRLETPLQADTLFGHLCWALRYLEGEDRLRNFLAAYQNSPPLILSDGFPVAPYPHAGERSYLPAPRLPVLTFEEQRQLLRDKGLSADKKHRTWLLGILKTLKKVEFLEDEAVLENASGLSPRRLLEALVDLTICPRTGAYNDWKGCPAKDNSEKCPGLGAKEGISCDLRPLSPATAPVMHNEVDRLAGGTIEGRLFSTTTYFPRCDYAVYALLDEARFPRTLLEKCLEFLCNSGFGKDKSSGCGSLSLKGISQHEFRRPENANAFLSLSSSYVPRQGDPRRGFYHLHVKRGKLGGHYVLEKKSPFKKPVAMFSAGSVFFLDGGHAKPFYGRLVPNVHPEDLEIVQYGYTYPLFLRLDEDWLKGVHQSETV